MKLNEDLKKIACEYRRRFLSVTNACRALHEVDVSEIKAGQLWKIVYGDAEAIFAVATSVPFKDQLSQEKAIRIVPIFCSPLQNCLCPKTDLVISDPEFLSGVSCLLEWWNERPVKLAQLNTLFGSLSDQDLKQLIHLLKTEPVPESNEMNFKLFREEEKALGALISSDYFDDLLCDDDAKNEEKSWLESVHVWLKKSFRINSLQPAFHCAGSGHSPEFRHCRAQMIRAIEETNKPKEIKAFTTLAGLTITFGCHAPITLILFDTDDQILKSFESKNGKISLREDDIESWEHVAGFKFVSEL